MTVVGKILVFLNLVFALVVFGVGVLDYGARTHWAAGYKKLEDNYKVTAASNRVYQGEVEKLTKEKADLNEQMTKAVGAKVELKGAEDATRVAQRVADALTKAQEQIEKLKGEVTSAKEAQVAAERKVKDAQAVADASLADVKRRQDDVDKMRATLKTEMTRNIDLVKDMNDLRDRAVGAEIQADTFKKMALRLEDELQKMARDMARLRANAGATTTAAGRGKNPPPDNVEGLIKRTDSSGLVTLTIGSDAGVTRGHTMEVFRLGRNPKYIGTIRILQATHNQAVGQPVGRLNGKIEIGDRVASRIMGGP
jgi:predicted  nucleic acid-binding Zn-ribbon protein